MKKQVLILNGNPRSGKDTFVDFISEVYAVRRYSSIDKVKELAMQFGWDGVKDEKGRKLLADLKRALVEYNDLPLKYMEEVYTDFMNSNDEVLCLFIRENAELSKAKELFNAITLYVNSNRVAPVLSNKSDSNIESNGYDYYIDNNGSLEDFRIKCLELMKEVYVDA